MAKTTAEVVKLINEILKDWDTGHYATVNDQQHIFYHRADNNAVIALHPSYLDAIKAEYIKRLSIMDLLN